MILSQHLSKKLARWALGLGMLFHWCGRCCFWFLLLSFEAKWCSPCVGSVAGKHCFVMKYLMIQWNSSCYFCELSQKSSLFWHLMYNQIDDKRIHINCCDLHYRKNWSTKGNLVHCSSALGGYSKHFILEVNIFFLT